ncbi:MAG: flagellin, partial [Paracoccaceae bacterium]|nr:flagellin [Paracoccaceae bacterium]
ISDADATANSRTAEEHITGNAATTATGNAMVTIGVIDAAIEEVNTQRSTLGATANRLNHTVNNLTNISANLSSAQGRIQDADFAIETTNLAKNQILQQASTAMLAQANASQANVLGLLRS